MFTLKIVSIVLEVVDLPGAVSSLSVLGVPELSQPIDPLPSFFHLW